MEELLDETGEIKETKIIDKVKPTLNFIAGHPANPYVENWRAFMANEITYEQLCDICYPAIWEDINTTHLTEAETEKTKGLLQYEERQLELCKRELVLPVLDKDKQDAIKERGYAIKNTIATLKEKIKEMQWSYNWWRFEVAEHMIKKENKTKTNGAF